jgi:hypothetical protein
MTINYDARIDTNDARNAERKNIFCNVLHLVAYGGKLVLRTRHREWIDTRFARLVIEMCRLSAAYKALYHA